MTDTDDRCPQCEGVPEVNADGILCACGWGMDFAAPEDDGPLTEDELPPWVRA